MHTIVRKTVIKLSSIPIITGILSLLAITLIPISVFAYGPDRPTFTMANPASYVTFNSITDNPSRGDERNFMAVREQNADNSTYSNDITLTPGDQYVVLIYYHNNASSSLNADGSGIAHGAYTRADIPSAVKPGVSTDAAAWVGASNANPASVYDDIHFENSTKSDISLSYVAGSTTIHNLGSINGDTLPDTILSSGGVALGYNALDGTVPGCNDYAGYVTFRVQAGQPSFGFTKQVRVHGTTTWQNSTTATPGTKVDYLLSYTNTGTAAQNDVVLKDQLPNGLTYVNGSTELTNSNNPKGKTLDDGISTTGMNIGSYNAGARAFLEFSATVGNVPCTTLTNTAAAETDNGNENATASVSTGSSCALPHTGPVQIIASLIGVAAITTGVVYYFMSRRELGTVMHETQLHPTIGGSTLLDSAPDHESKPHHDHKKP